MFKFLDKNIYFIGYEKCVDAPNLDRANTQDMMQHHDIYGHFHF